MTIIIIKDTVDTTTKMKNNNNEADFNVQYNSALQSLTVANLVQL